MRAKLTERERRVVLAIHRLPRPTFRELADYIGWRSTSTLFAHVRQLRRKRVLTQPAMRWLAEDGQEFNSDDVRAMVGDPPRGVHVNLVGALFVAAATSGLIKPVGFTHSTRLVGHGNWVRSWVGVRGGAGS